MSRIGRCAAAAVFAAATLAGCEEGDPEPRISPSPASSVSPAPAATSATPQKETPEAFIRRWGVVSAQMQNSGDAAAYREVVDPSCQPCLDFVDLVLGYYANGGYVKAVPWEVRNVEPRPPKNGKEAEFEVQLVTSPTEFKQSADAEVQTLKGGPTKLAVTLREGDQWRVLNYLVIAS